MNYRNCIKVLEDLLVVDEYKKVPQGIAMLGYETLNSFLYSNSHFLVKDQKFEDSEKKCRICHKKESDGVTFKNKAHIVPEFLGNTTYFSYYECDSCNSKYGQLEEKLKKFLSFELYHVGIRNTKKECNVYNVTKNGRSGIYSSPINQPYTVFKKIVSEVSGREGRFTVNKEEKIITETIKTEKYVPYDVFLALCKISLLMIPESELEMAGYLRKLITSEVIYGKSIVIKKKFLDINTIRNIMYTSIIKREDKNYIMILGLRNYIFEIHLPIKESSESIVTRKTSILKNHSDDTYITLNDKEVVESIEKECHFSYGELIELQDMKNEHLDLLGNGISKLYPKNKELFFSVLELKK